MAQYAKLFELNVRPVCVGLLPSHFVMTAVYVNVMCIEMSLIRRTDPGEYVTSRNLFISGLKIDFSN